MKIKWNCPLPVRPVSLDRPDLHVLGSALLRDVRIDDEGRLRRLPAVPARQRSQLLEILEVDAERKSFSVERWSQGTASSCPRTKMYTGLDSRERGSWYFSSNVMSWCEKYQKMQIPCFGVLLNFLMQVFLNFLYGVRIYTPSPPPLPCFWG